LKLGVPKEVARGAGDIVLAAPLNEILLAVSLPPSWMNSRI
jgi:hypothetical protein